MGIAIACILYLFPAYWWNLDLPKVKDKRLYFFGLLNSIHIWMLILSILGFAKVHLNFSNNFLKMANKAVYPFYILHQTLIVSFGYYITQWPLPIFVKMVLLILLTFLSLVLIYRYIIKPFKLMRIFYGLKPNEKSNQH